jgi:hypothetical protein
LGIVFFFLLSFFIFFFHFLLRLHLSEYSRKRFSQIFHSVLGVIQCPFVLLRLSRSCDHRSLTTQIRFRGLARLMAAGHAALRNYTEQKCKNNLKKNTFKTSIHVIDIVLRISNAL